MSDLIQMNKVVKVEDISMADTPLPKKKSQHIADARD